MEKIKQFLEGKQGKDVLTILIIILVGCGSFGLGRLSHNDLGPGIVVSEYNLVSLANVVTSATPPNIPDKIPVQISQPETPKKTAKNYFASSRGSKYYSIGCSGGKTLKEENKVWFATKEEAEKAGYELSSTCKQ